MNPLPRIVAFGRHEGGGKLHLIEDGPNDRLQVIDKDERILLDYTSRRGWIVLSPTGRYALIAEWAERGVEVEVLGNDGVRLWKQVIPGEASFAVSDGGMVLESGSIDGDRLKLILPDGSSRKMISRSRSNIFAWSPDGKVLLIIFEGIPVLQCYSHKGEIAYELELSELFGKADLARIGVWNDCASVFAVKPKASPARSELVSVSSAGAILIRREIGNEDLGGLYAANSSANPDFAYFNNSRFVHVCHRATLQSVKSIELPPGDAIVSIHMGRRPLDLAAVAWREELRSTTDTTRIVRVIHNGKLQREFHGAKVAARYLNEFRPQFDFLDDALQVPEGLGLRKMRAEAD